MADIVSILLKAACTVPPEVHLMHGYASNGEPVTDAAWLAMLLPEDRQRVGEETRGRLCGAAAGHRYLLSNRTPDGRHAAFRKALPH
ncbi:MAG: hypothetical protein WDN04_18535 [Rhodospirillales bacterium]